MSQVTIQRIEQGGLAGAKAVRRGLHAFGTANPLTFALLTAVVVGVAAWNHLWVF